MMAHTATGAGSMPWEACHRQTILSYWRRTDYVDFGDASDANRNRFARRVRDMMGEESQTAAWTVEMENLLVAFLDAFYELPQGLTVARRGYRPTFTSPQLAESVSRGLTRLTLTPTPRNGGPRLQKALLGQGYPGLDDDVAAIRGFMQLYLLRGFIPYARTNGSAIVGVPANDFLDRFAPLPDSARTNSLATFCQRVLKQTQADTFAWRGDDRSLLTVTAAGGLMSKVISNPQYMLDINLSRAWHAFSDDAFRDHMYFRRGQKDNCLDTCVSVILVGADDRYLNEEFKTNACFPQLCTFPENRRSRADVRYVPAGDRTVVEERRHVDVVRLYLLKIPLGARYVDTSEAQHQFGSERFPEAAVRGVRNDDICGYLTYVRVHHGNGDRMDEGFDAVPVVGDSHTRLTRPSLASQVVFDAANNRFSRCWAPDGSRNVGPLAASYQAIGQARVNNDKISGLPLLIR